MRIYNLTRFPDFRMAPFFRRKLVIAGVARIRPKVLWQLGVSHFISLPKDVGAWLSFSACNSIPFCFALRFAVISSNLSTPFPFSYVVKILEDLHPLGEIMDNSYKNPHSFYGITVMMNNSEFPGFLGLEYKFIRIIFFKFLPKYNILFDRNLSVPMPAITHISTTPPTTHQ